MLLGILDLVFKKRSSMYVEEILLLACLVNNNESSTKDISVDV